MKSPVPAMVEAIENPALNEKAKTAGGNNPEAVQELAQAFSGRSREALRAIDPESAVQSGVRQAGG